MNPVIIDQVVRQQEEIESLRQQLTDHIKREVMLREKFQELADNFIWNGDDYSYHHWVIEVSQEALAATADLENVRLCHADIWGLNVLENEPLYRAWEPKP